MSIPYLFETEQFITHIHPFSTCILFALCLSLLIFFGFVFLPHFSRSIFFDCTLLLTHLTTHQLTIRSWGINQILVLIRLLLISQWKPLNFHENKMYSLLKNLCLCCTYRKARKRKRREYILCCNFHDVRHEFSPRSMFSTVFIWRYGMLLHPCISTWYQQILSSTIMVSNLLNSIRILGFCSLH